MLWYIALSLKMRSLVNIVVHCHPRARGDPEIIHDLFSFHCPHFHEGTIPECTGMTIREYNTPTSHFEVKRVYILSIIQNKAYD